MMAVIGHGINMHTHTGSHGIMAVVSNIGVRVGGWVGGGEGDEVWSWETCTEVRTA